MTSPRRRSEVIATIDELHLLDPSISTCSPRGGRGRGLPDYRRVGAGRQFGEDPSVTGPRARHTLLLLPPTFGIRPAPSVRHSPVADTARCVDGSPMSLERRGDSGSRSGESR